MFDLAFVLKDCHGDIDAAQRRVDRALRQARAEGKFQAYRDIASLLRESREFEWADMLEKTASEFTGTESKA